MLYTVACDISSYLLYSAWCQSSHSLCACVGLRHAKNAILNTPLNQQEYEETVPKIIDHMRATGEWGEFFHPSMSPFGYNETIGADDQPLDRTTVEKYGWNWYDIPKKERQGTYIVPLDTAQYNPEKVSKEVAEKNIDTLLAGILQCEKTGEPFRILKEELRFYIAQDMPIPRRHPQVRYNDRLQFITKKTLHTAECTHCKKQTDTTYDSSQRVILCEECYRKLVY